ncbi:DsbA family protein [Mycolicibacterium komossense]|uniref:Thioredoxin domain-containing protein n=1 Tax=Mycolicibacterium komossense TaxID=1779 RepID=A0ABT3CGL0_9MYCO|nr:DsbA family protein [Mycolicibacterium komossense]MCV7228647.1 thioredoxin domain-containing protein [Mycolicibacterium komossense]
MATKPKRPAKYDLKSADRKRNLAIQIGLTAAVVLFAVALVLYIVMSSDKKHSGDLQAVRVASSDVIKKDGSSDPKAVLSVYEDFQCPHCRDFEKAFGRTIGQLVTSGAIAVDYNMVSILNSSANQKYSTRSANAAYCVGDADTTPTKENFVRFHTALFAQQPPEGAPAPDNAGLIETARQAGTAPDKITDCVNSGKYSDMVDGLAAASKINATPTVRLNGEDIQLQTPADLVAKVKAIVGDVPGMDVPAAPAAPAPVPVPAAPPAS